MKANFPSKAITKAEITLTMSQCFQFDNETHKIVLLDRMTSKARSAIH